MHSTNNILDIWLFGKRHLLKIWSWDHRVRINTVHVITCGRPDCEMFCSKSVTFLNNLSTSEEVANGGVGTASATVMPSLKAFRTWKSEKKSSLFAFVHKCHPPFIWAATITPGGGGNIFRNKFTDSKHYSFFFLKMQIVCILMGLKFKTLSALRS